MSVASRKLEHLDSILVIRITELSLYYLLLEFGQNLINYRLLVSLRLPLSDVNICNFEIKVLRKSTFVNDKLDDVC